MVSSFCFLEVGVLTDESVNISAKLLNEFLTTYYEKTDK